MFTRFDMLFLNPYRSKERTFLVMKTTSMQHWRRYVYTPVHVVVGNALTGPDWQWEDVL